MSLLAIKAFAAGPQQAVPDFREAVARRMAAGLAAQRESIARQGGAPVAGGFFLLPPPTASKTPVPTAPAPSCPPLDELEVVPLIEDAAKREDLQPALLDRVARQESGLSPCAVSAKGVMGLMQIMPDTARDLGIQDPFDPKESIDGAARLLRKYLDLYGNLPMALGAYNAGPARVDEAGGVPRIPETLDYVQRILSFPPLGSRK